MGTGVQSLCHCVPYPCPARWVWSKSCSFVLNLVLFFKKVRNSIRNNVTLPYRHTSVHNDNDTTLLEGSVINGPVSLSQPLGFPIHSYVHTHTRQRVLHTRTTIPTAPTRKANGGCFRASTLSTFLCGVSPSYLGSHMSLLS